MNNILEIKDLVKTYDNFKLDNININLPKGQIIGLIGENGAGKTTLIKAILNIIKMDSGSIKCISKEDIGVVLDDMFFPEILTIKDINSIMKDIYKTWDSSKYDQYINNFDLDKNKKIKELSKGMRKKLEIATALSHKPKLLILDEPTSGLDPVIRNEVLDVFLDFIQDEENTILFSTHITTDLEHIADRIIFIDNGKIVLEEDKDELLDSYGIIKCDVDKFKNIDKNDIIKYKKNKYEYQILVKDREKLKKKYKDYVLDKITLDDLMVLMIRGE